MQQIFLKNKKKIVLGCRIIVQIETKKNYNSANEVSIFGKISLNVDLHLQIYQLSIDYLEEIFLETLEIFLAAVFLLIIPDLATCIRID